MKAVKEAMTDLETRKIQAGENRIKQLKEDIKRLKKIMDHKFDWYFSCDEANGALPDDNWAEIAKTVADKIKEIKSQELFIRKIWSDAALRD